MLSRLLSCADSEWLGKYLSTLTHASLAASGIAAPSTATCAEPCLCSVGWHCRPSKFVDLSFDSDLEVDMVDKDQHLMNKENITPR